MWQDLNKLAAIVRGELPKLSRAVLCALITLDVHARDMVTGMVKREVSLASPSLNSCLVCGTVHCLNISSTKRMSCRADDDFDNVCVEDSVGGNGDDNGDDDEAGDFDDVKYSDCQEQPP